MNVSSAPIPVLPALPFAGRAAARAVASLPAPLDRVTFGHGGHPPHHAEQAPQAKPAEKLGFWGNLKQWFQDLWNNLKADLQAFWDNITGKKPDEKKPHAHCGHHHADGSPCQGHH